MIWIFLEKIFEDGYNKEPKEGKVEEERPSIQRWNKNCINGALMKAFEFKNLFLDSIFVNKL